MNLNTFVVEVILNIRPDKELMSIDHMMEILILTHMPPEPPNRT